MDTIYKLLKRIVPASFNLKFIRYLITLCPWVAEKCLNYLTRPLGKQKRYIRKIRNEHWEGALIMPDMISCDEETAIRRLQNADIVIFEIHGGGFRTGHSTMFMASFISWIEIMKSKYNLNACIMSVDYGLAPKHYYPGPLLQCQKAYMHLIQDLGVSPSKIIMSGDSAGGSLVLETLIRTYVPSLLNDSKATRSNFDIGFPAGALLVSPLVSGNDMSHSWIQFEDTDVVSRHLRHLILKEYIFRPETPIQDLQLIRLNTLQQALEHFLPKQVLIFVGNRETMRDDILEFAESVERGGTSEITVVNEDYPHDWFLAHDLIDRKGKQLIAKYDELFVDFAVNAVNNYQDKSVDSDDTESVSTCNSTVKSENNGLGQIEIPVNDQKVFMNDFLSL